MQSKKEALKPVVVVVEQPVVKPAKQPVVPGQKDTKTELAVQQMQKNTVTTFRKIQEDISLFSTLYKEAEKLMRERESEYYTKLTKDKDG